MKMNSFSGNSNWVMKIIFINLGIFLIQHLIFEGGITVMNYYFGLTPVLVVKKFYVWQFVTYMFLHGNFFHIFFNMYGVLLFGSSIEQLWGAKKFLLYYFFTGIGAGLTIFVVNYFIIQVDISIPTIGASGALFGLLLAFGILFPNAELLIFFVLPIKAKYLVFMYGAIELTAQITSGGNSGISHLGHLGGLLFGLIYFAVSKKRGIEFSAKKMKARMDKEVQERGRIFNSDGKDTVKRLSAILEKLKNDGVNGINDDEYQFIKLTDILHADESNIDESTMCPPSDFDTNDEHCRKCETLEACLMREIRKYL